MEMKYMKLTAFQLNNFSPWRKSLQAYGAFIAFLKNDVSIRELSKLPNQLLILSVERSSISEITIYRQDIDRHHEDRNTGNKNKQAKRCDKAEDSYKYPVKMNKV